MSANEMGAYPSAWVLWENSSIVFARADTMGILAVTDCPLRLQSRYNRGIIYDGPLIEA
jgi:hypothetical protein